jgi:hypothetical protein
MKIDKRSLIAVLVVFLLIEASAALWHLLLFRDFYADVTAQVDRGSPTTDYIIPHLIVTNILRSIAIVVFFKLFTKGVLLNLLGDGEVTMGDALRFGAMLGIVSALFGVEYYGIWKISSFSWVLMEGSWAVLQGLAYGWGLGMCFRSSSDKVVAL